MNETREDDDAVDAVGDEELILFADDTIIFLAATVTFVLVISIVLLLCVGE